MGGTDVTKRGLSASTGTHDEAPSKKLKKETEEENPEQEAKAPQDDAAKPMKGSDKDDAAGGKAKKSLEGSHPQQGRVPLFDLPERKWYELDVKAPYPEGENVAVRCSKCGENNRMDRGWRYCRDRKHANEQAAMSLMYGDQLRKLWASIHPELANRANMATLKYECRGCRADRANLPDDDEGDEGEDTEEEEEEEASNE